MPETTEKSVDVEAETLLKALVNESIKFLQNNDYLKEFDFIDRVFDELKIDYLVQHDEIRNIPATGRVCQFTA